MSEVDLDLEAILEAMDSDTDDSNNSFCPITTQQQQVDSNKSGANNNGTDKNRVGDNINIDSSSNISSNNIDSNNSNNEIQLQQSQQKQQQQQSFSYTYNNNSNNRTIQNHDNQNKDNVEHILLDSSSEGYSGASTTNSTISTQRGLGVVGINGGGLFNNSVNNRENSHNLSQESNSDDNILNQQGSSSSY